jgi:quinoprotein glucose dehydrogenase
MGLGNNSDEDQQSVCHSKVLVGNLSLMKATSLAVYCLIALLHTLPISGVLAAGDDQAPRPEPPKVSEASEEGENAIASFKIPAGWRCELVAAEPDVANPVVFTITNDGRIFVCESFRQNDGITDNRGHDREWLLADLAAQSVADRIAYHKKLLPDQGASFVLKDDRIRLLRDQDGDGTMDSSVVFADGFNNLEDGTGAGILVRGNEAFFTCIPKLWRLTDADGDGLADKREALYDGFGVRVAFRGHDMHGLVMGPDGRIYFSIGDRGYNVETEKGKFFDPASGAVFRCEADGSNLELFATGLRNPQELAFDDFGNLFTGDNNSDSGDRARWVNVVRGGDSGWRMYYQYISDRGPFNREKIWYPFHEQTPAYTIPPIANFADGPSGLTYYPGTGLSDAFKNTFFLVDFRGQASNSGVRTLQVKPKGAFFELGDNSETIWNILGTDADFGPDGALYVTDWVNGWNGEGKGRIYRFFDPEQRDAEIVKSTKELLAKGFASETIATLTMLLKHPDRRVRLECQYELAKRNAVEDLANIAVDNSLEVIHRLHGVWGLGQIARQKGETEFARNAVLGLVSAMGTEEPLIIASACTALAEATPADLGSHIVPLVKHADPRVQAAAAQAVGLLHLSTALNSVCQMLATNADADPILRHAGIMALAGQTDMTAVAQLTDHPSASVRVAAVVALRKRSDDRIADFLGDTDTRVVLEAARAIHDVSTLTKNMDKLAALLPTLPNDDNLLHRALNANYRAGTKEGCQRIAAFAADSRRSNTLRLEAVNMLGGWETPDPLDRVIGDYRPLEPRDKKIAMNALRERLVAIVGGTDALRVRAMEVASEMGIQEVLPMLTKVLKDKNAPGSDRASALRGLARLAKDAAKETIVQSSTDASPMVRVAALELLVPLDPNLAITAIRRASKSEIVFERQAAWDAIKELKTEQANEFLASGVEQYLTGNMPKDVWLNIVEAAKGRIHGDLENKLREHQSRLTALEASDPVAAYQDTVEGGDAMRGRDLFFNRSQLSCVRCHKVATRGGEVGPALTEIAVKKDKNYLLEAIVAPNAKIAENFETVILATDDDQVITGVLRKEDTENIQVILADGTVVNVPVEGVVARRKGVSSMPADLMKYLSRRELRDLVAYLAILDGKHTNSILESTVDGHK